MPDLAQLNLVIKSTQVKQATDRLFKFEKAGRTADRVAEDLRRRSERLNKTQQQTNRTFSTATNLILKYASALGVAAAVTTSLVNAAAQERRLVAFETA